jgi:hypothetical protein
MVTQVLDAMPAAKLAALATPDGTIDGEAAFGSKLNAVPEL